MGHPGAAAADGAVERILAEVAERRGIDFRDYRADTLRNRLESRMRAAGCADLATHHARLIAEREEIVIQFCASKRAEEQRGGFMKAVLIDPTAKAISLIDLRSVNWATNMFFGEKPAPAPFRYRHQGDLATIGRKSAIVKLGRLALTGFIGWAFWGLVHVYFLIGVRNRLAVAFSWLWDYVTFGRRSRLITDPGPM